PALSPSAHRTSRLPSCLLPRPRCAHAGAAPPAVSQGALRIIRLVKILFAPVRGAPALVQHRQELAAGRDTGSRAGPSALSLRDGDRTMRLNPCPAPAPP